MKPTRLEPGLLPLFRLLLVVQLLFMLVNLHVHSARGLLPGDTDEAFPFVIGGTLFLLIYLTWPWLQARLGRFYLPGAVVFAASFSILAQNLFLAPPLASHTGASAESAWQSFLYLFAPLVLVGWQYGFGAVTVYCLFTTIVEFAFVRCADPDCLVTPDTVPRLLFIRFLSFMLVGYIVSRIMGQLRRERQALQEANRQLERFVATVEQLTVSRERNRVARELHDTLAHTLSGVALQLEAANSLWSRDSDRAQALLQHSLKATRDGLAEMRQAIQSLRAAPLEDLGLANALREYAEATAGRTGFRLDLDLPPDLKGLPPEVEQCFYRIGQEALENAARHAQAKSLRLRLARTAPELRLEIADDGVGFDPPAVEAGRHFGLQGMRERAGLIHADLAIVSRPGEGARLSLAWREEDRQNGGQA